MRIMLDIMIYMLLINVASGLVFQTGIIDIPGSSPFEDYNEGYIESLYNTTGRNISAPPMENELNFGERILDFFSMGMYDKLKSFINRWVYALPTMFENLGVINQPVAYVIKGLITLILCLGLIELFTGKPITGTAEVGN